MDQIARLKNKETKYFELYINILDLARRAREIYERRSPEEKRLLLKHIFTNLTPKDRKTIPGLKRSIEVIAKRVQEKLDTQNNFELEQKTTKSLIPAGPLSPSRSIPSLKPTKTKNNFRTSKKLSVKTESGHSVPNSTALLRR